MNFWNYFRAKRQVIQRRPYCESYEKLGHAIELLRNAAGDIADADVLSFEAKAALLSELNSARHLIELKQASIRHKAEEEAKV